MHFDGDATDSTGKSTQTTSNVTFPKSTQKFVTASCYFHGSSSYVQGSMAAALGTGDFTIECWLNLTSISSYQTFFSFANRGNTGISIGVSSGYLATYDGSSSTYSSGSPLTAGSFGHVCIMRSSSTLYFYVNGVLAGSTAWSRNVTSTIFRLGNLIDNGNDQVTGYMDDFRISNTAKYTTSGFTVPTAPFTTAAVKQYTLSHYGINAQSSLPFTTLSASATLAEGNTYLVSSGAYTLTLPTPGYYPCPTIKIINLSSSSQTISGAIEGSSSTTKPVPAATSSSGTSMELAWNGTYWYRLMGGSGIGSTATTTLGTITTGTWNGSAISIAYGGTGKSSWTSYSMPYASGSTTLSEIAPNTAPTKKYLAMTGTGSAGAAPAWDTVAGSGITGVDAWTDSGTLSLADINKLVTVTHTATAGKTVTIPLYSAVAFPTYTYIEVQNISDVGVTTIAGASGVTVNGVSGGSLSIGRNQRASLFCTAQNTWAISRPGTILDGIGASDPVTVIQPTGGNTQIYAIGLSYTVPQVTNGTAAPTSTPAKVGDIHVDATNKKIYVATGSSSSSDWTAVN